MKRRAKILLGKTKGKVPVPERLKAMDMNERHAVLATNSKGQPYTSLVAYAMTPDMRGVIFATPKKTSKYRNLLSNKKVALLIDTRSNTGMDYINAEAVTIIGTAKPVRRGKMWEDLSHILIRKHPELKEFIRFKTTALVLVEASQCFHVGSFQRVSEWRLR
jgi:nitroimidazol reductase NimA-like FMN-containing flavoprotein (pyridoxamine 5'-phosphate oxidase superfamily)